MKFETSQCQLGILLKKRKKKKMKYVHDLTHSYQKVAKVNIIETTNTGRKPAAPSGSTTK